MDAQSQPKPRSLQELLQEMQQMQAHQEDETVRLRRRLAWLESRRREFFDIVAFNSSDFETRRKLEETEKQLEELQGLLNRAETDLKQALRELRQRIIELRNRELTRLEDEIKTLRARKHEVHNELLPEAQSHVAALREEEERLDQRLEEVLRRVRDLSQLDLPTTQVA